MKLRYTIGATLLSAFYLFMTIGISGCSLIRARPNTPPALALTQDVQTAVDLIVVLDEGVRGAANHKLITKAEAIQVLDLSDAALDVLKATNGGAYTTVSELLKKIEALPVAAKIKPYIDQARAGLATLQFLRGDMVIPTAAVGGVELLVEWLPSIFGFITSLRKRQGVDLSAPMTPAEIDAAVAHLQTVIAFKVDQEKAKNAAFRTS